MLFFSRSLGEREVAVHVWGIGIFITDSLVSPGNLVCRQRHRQIGKWTVCEREEGEGERERERVCVCVCEREREGGRESGWEGGREGGRGRESAIIHTKEGVWGSLLRMFLLSTFNAPFISPPFTPTTTTALLYTLSILTSPTVMTPYYLDSCISSFKRRYSLMYARMYVYVTQAIPLPLSYTVSMCILSVQLSDACKMASFSHGDSTSRVRIILSQRVESYVYIHMNYCILVTVCTYTYTQFHHFMYVEVLPAEEVFNSDGS